MKKSIFAICTLMMCIVLIGNVKGQFSYVRAQFGVGNVSHDSSTAYVVYVQKIDSTVVYSVTEITQHAANVNIRFYFSAGTSDSITIPINGLVKNSAYLVRSSILTDSSRSFVRSQPVDFTTPQCWYVPVSGFAAKNPCTDSVWVNSIPAGSTTQWVKGISNYSTQQWFLTAQPGSYFCIVTDPTGCTMNTPPMIINIDGLIATTSGPATICKNTSTELSVSVNTSGTFTCSWLPVTGLSNPNISNPIASPNVTTTYVATVTLDGCHAIAPGLKVTVNSNTENAQILSPKDGDTACKSGITTLPIVVKVAGGTLTGKGVTGNMFVPEYANLGVNWIVHSLVDANGCIAKDSVAVWVIDSPFADSVKMINGTLIVYGKFPYPIYIFVGQNKYTTLVQDNRQAIFNGVALQNGDLIIIQSSIGGCFVTKQYASFAYGIDEKTKKISIKKGEKLMLVNMLGQIISTQHALTDLSSEYDVCLAFKSAGVEISPETIYLFRSENGASGKIPIVIK